MSNVPVANIRNLDVGLSVNKDHLFRFINNQAYQSHHNQLVGEVALWERGGPILEAHHLEMAPNGTFIQLREHYYGSADLIKYNDKWVVTRICLRCG